MVRKVTDPLDEAYLLPLERMRRAINTKLKYVSGARIAYPSASGHTLELRIGFETYRGWGYVDMAIWFLKEDGEWRRTYSGVTMSPFYVLAGVIKALKQVRRGKEFRVRKGRRPGAKGRDVIRVKLETVERDESVEQVVDVRLLALDTGGHKATRKGLAIPLDLLPSVIGALENFAKAVGQVNSSYLRPLRLVDGSDRY